MRGWLHVWSFAVSIVTCAALVAFSAILAGGTAAVATAVYGATTLGLFGTSSLYHRRTWRTSRSRTAMKRLDHSMIFLFIAGTYTAVTALTMNRPTAQWVLTVVWTGAIGGVVLKLVWPHAPAVLAIPIYLALGWVALFVLPDLLAGGGVTAFVLLLAGGVFYTAGGMCYGTRWPDPWPHTFGYHEFFHAATVIAALCQHIAIWLALF